MMQKRPTTYILSLVAGAALLAAAGAGSVRAMPLTGTPAAAPAADVAPQIEKAQYWRWHRRWWGPRWGYGGGWRWRHRGWCYWHPYAC